MLLLIRRELPAGMMERLAWLFATPGAPKHLRSDNGSEFTAQGVRAWLAKVGVRTLYIEPGCPWENGYVEGFNGKLRDELLNGEIFTTLTEARVLIERRRREYNTMRPHSSLGYRPPAQCASLSGAGPELTTGRYPSYSCRVRSGSYLRSPGGPSRERRVWGQPNACA